MCFGQSLYIPPISYIFDMFLNCILAGLIWGHIKVPGKECHGMCLGSQFPIPCRVDESVHFSVHALSEGFHSMYQMHAHEFPTKRA